MNGGLQTKLPALACLGHERQRCHAVRITNFERYRMAAVSALDTRPRSASTSCWRMQLNQNVQQSPNLTATHGRSYLYLRVEQRHLITSTALEETCELC